MYDQVKKSNHSRRIKPTTNKLTITKRKCEKLQEPWDNSKWYLFIDITCTIIFLMVIVRNIHCNNNQQYVKGYIATQLI